MTEIAAYESAAIEAARVGGEVLRKRFRTAMAGRVARIHVQSGTAVLLGDPLMVLEAMKMQNDVKASCAGIVEEILVAQGASVELDALLVRIRPQEEKE